MVNHNNQLNQRPKTIMETLLKSLLQSTTETEVLEFKEAKNQYDKDKLGKYFSALGNEANLKGKAFAYLIMGVKNDKTIVGTTISDAQINDYKKEIAYHTSPCLSFTHVYRVNHAEGNVLIFEIPAAPVGMPISWKGHRYGRDGESLGGLNDNEIDRIRLQTQHVDWSKEIICDATIEDIDEQALIKAREQFSEKNPHLKEEIQQWDDSTFLNKAKLTINGQITRAAILLLGKSESEHYLNPATAKITWILKDRDGIEKDYEHFSCPLLLEVNKVYSKIRIIKYRYLKEGTLFPDEVDQFEPYTIREAINNCIAHQDYSIGGRINVVEREDGVLTFSNAGSFIPQSIKKVITSDAPEELYRNPFLANAMVSLNMIDTIGSGIKKMFLYQKNKFFPLPEYDISNNKVQVQIIGKVVNEDYARKLAQSNDLTLSEIFLLDKVAKQKELTVSEIAVLKQKKLIEGRKPNFHISSGIAKLTGERESYIKHKGFDDKYYEKLIVEYIKKFKEASNKNISELLFDKLPDILNETQKKNKIRNMLQKLKRSGKIVLNESRKWKLE